MCFVLYLMWSLTGSSSLQNCVETSLWSFQSHHLSPSWCWVLSLCPVAMILGLCSRPCGWGQCSVMHAGDMLRSVTDQCGLPCLHCRVRRMCGKALPSPVSLALGLSVLACSMLRIIYRLEVQKKKKPVEHNTGQTFTKVTKSSNQTDLLHKGRGLYVKNCF